MFMGRRINMIRNLGNHLEMTTGVLPGSKENAGATSKARGHLWVIASDGGGKGWNVEGRNGRKLIHNVGVAQLCNRKCILLGHRLREHSADVVSDLVLRTKVLLQPVNEKMEFGVLIIVGNNL